MLAYFEYSRCPKCGHESDGSDICPACGAVFSKIRSREIEEDALGPHDSVTESPPHEAVLKPDSRPRWIIGAMVVLGLLWAGWQLYSNWASSDPMQLMAQHRTLISRALKTATSSESAKDKAADFEKHIRECSALRGSVLKLQSAKPGKDPIADVRITALLYANELLDLEFDSITNDIALGQSPGGDRKLFAPVQTVLQIVENPYSGADQAAAAQAVLKNSIPDAKVVESLRATGDRLAERRRQVREQIALTVEGAQKARALQSFDEMHYGADAAKAPATK